MWIVALALRRPVAGLDERDMPAQRATTRIAIGISTRKAHPNGLRRHRYPFRLSRHLRFLSAAVGDLSSASSGERVRLQFDTSSLVTSNSGVARTRLGCDISVPTNSSLPMRALLGGVRGYSWFVWTTIPRGRASFEPSPVSDSSKSTS